MTWNFTRKWHLPWWRSGVDKDFPTLRYYFTGIGPFQFHWWGKK